MLKSKALKNLKNKTRKIREKLKKTRWWEWEKEEMSKEKRDWNRDFTTLHVYEILINEIE